MGDFHIHQLGTGQKAVEKLAAGFEVECGESAFLVGTHREQGRNRTLLHGGFKAFRRKRKRIGPELHEVTTFGHGPRAGESEGRIIDHTPRHLSGAEKA